MVRDGTTSQANTTWASRNPKSTAKSNEQVDVGNNCRLHINFLIRLHHINIKWAKSQTDIG
jgi:hypothetical protein